MPFLNLKIAGPTLDGGTIRDLQHDLTAKMADILGKKADLTAILIEQVPDAAAWSVGGEPVPVAAYLDVKITAGTNTSAQKARFIHDAHAMLKATLGSNIPTATYVVLHEVAADAWGYSGLTQAHRRDVADKGSP